MEWVPQISILTLLTFVVRAAMNVYTVRKYWVTAVGSLQEQLGQTTCCITLIRITQGILLAYIILLLVQG